jgi:hypothetical protein
MIDGAGRIRTQQGIWEFRIELRKKKAKRRD